MTKVSPPDACVRLLAILDVGHGNCAVLQNNCRTTVIDTGSGSSLLEYLSEQGIKRIDTVLISHADEDHIGGLAGLLSSGLFEFGSIRLNTDSIQGSKIWDDLVYELSRQGTKGNVDFKPGLTAADNGLFDDEPLKIEVLGPSTYLAVKGPGGKDRSGRKIRTNSISSVIRILNHDSPVAIFPGDLDEIGLADLLDNGANLNASLLVFPHHGGLAGSPNQTDNFARQLCSAVSPVVVVFSIGRSRKPPYPRPEVIRVVREGAKAAHIMCTQLSEHCVGIVPLEEPIHLSGVFSQGKESRSCCAGTIVLDLTSSDSIRPSYADHNSFVDSVAPNGLCRQSWEPFA